MPLIRNLMTVFLHRTQFFIHVIPVYYHYPKSLAWSWHSSESIDNTFLIVIFAPKQHRWAKTNEVIVAESASLVTTQIISAITRNTNQSQIQCYDTRLCWIATTPVRSWAIPRLFEWSLSYRSFLKLLLTCSFSAWSELPTIVEQCDHVRSIIYDAPSYIYCFQMINFSEAGREVAVN